MKRRLWKSYYFKDRGDGDQFISGWPLPSEKDTLEVKDKDFVDCRFHPCCDAFKFVGCTFTNCDGVGYIL